MNWRAGQADSRKRYLEKFDRAEADRYEAVVGGLSGEDEEAYLCDLTRVVRLGERTRVLDAGAGTGALCGVLLRLPGVAITALEPSPSMLERFRSKSALAGVEIVEGFCDSSDDRRHFGAGQFDAIVSRQLVNGLYDPLTAFRNWHYWLADAGRVVVMDGLYVRAAWTGIWEEEVDELPHSACQSTAMTPYLLEAAGFSIETVGWMDAVNQLPSTRTKRYVVVARR